MAGKPQYKNPPNTPTNQWVRDALEYAGLGFPEAAIKMTAEIGKNYDRSTIQKMTVFRKVTAEEQLALSKITGYPMAGVDDDLAKFLRLDGAQRKAVLALMDALLSDSKADGQ